MRDTLFMFQSIEICHSVRLVFNRKRMIPKNNPKNSSRQAGWEYFHPDWRDISPLLSDTPPFHINSSLDSNAKPSLNNR